MQEQIQELVRIVRQGPIAQNERIRAVSELAHLLGSEELAQAAGNMRQISRAEVDFLPFKRLQAQEAPMWALLNQALAAAGYPPAATLDEVISGNAGKTTPQQIGEGFGSEVVTYTLEKLKAETPSYIYATLIEAMGWINDAEAVPFILAALDHKDLEVRRSAVIASSAYTAPELHERLLARLETETNTSILASIPLGLRHTKDEAVIKQIGDWVQTHENYNLRQNAALTLSQMEQFELLFEIISALKGDVKQAAAIKALGESSHETAFEALIDYVGANDYRVQMRAIDTLNGTTDERAFEAFTKALLTGSYSVRKSAIRALTQYGDRCVEFLEQVLDHVALPPYAQKKPQMYKTVGEVAKIALEELGTPAALEAAAKWIPPEESTPSE